MADSVSMRIRKRTFEFEPDLMRQHWNSGDPCLTHTFSVASIILDLGETFLVSHTTKLAAEIDDSRVRDRAKLFIGQEACHRHMHVEYNRALRAAGYRTEPLFAVVRVFIKSIAKYFNRRWLLASLVSVEYLAALTAERLFGGQLGQDVQQSETDIAKFWRWHLAEEAEHRTVMHEIYRNFGGSTVPLTITTWSLAVIFYLFINFGMVWLVLTGPAPKSRLLTSLFHYNFGRSATFLWLPWKLLRGTWQKFDPTLVCSRVRFESYLDA